MLFNAIKKAEIFNFVVKHLLTQNAQALAEDSFACQYHAFDGKKCAIGCLIPEDAYDPRIEGLAASFLLDAPDVKLTEAADSQLLDYTVARAVRRRFGLSLTEPLDENDKAFIGGLQIIHDKCPPAAWKGLLIEFAIGQDINRPKELRT